MFQDRACTFPEPTLEACTMACVPGLEVAHHNDAETMVASGMSLASTLF